MIKKLRIALVQMNALVGDIEGNLTKHLEAIHYAQQKLKANAIVFPELSLTGYPPEDLLFRKNFIQKTQEALHTLKNHVKDIYCIVGHPNLTPQGLQNACSVIYQEKTLGRYAKQYLPNYGIFDENRYFTPGNDTCVIPIHGVSVGIIICEDLWHPLPIQQAAAHGAQCIIIPNASPFEINKHEERTAILAERAKTHRLPLCYVNCIGGQDELLFDGGSMIVNEAGEICENIGFFTESIHPVDMEFTHNQIHIEKKPLAIPTPIERIYQGLTLGVRDYVEKNHFSRVLLGLSGGIDSALTLAIAVDALGSDRVTAIIMPSRYTAEMSIEDAKILANNLGVRYEILSIEPSFTSFLDTLTPLFASKKPSITEENIQSRCRAVLLMALSNARDELLLATGNRSEFAVGYTTLYGDMAGALAVLKDVLKTQVYELVAYRNYIHPAIPQRIIDRPPSAELAINQKDEDSLPPYPVLDKILWHYLNQEQSAEDIISQGFSPEIVEKVITLIKNSEYKRRQAPPGIRVNHKAFGRDRRYPITSGFKG
ncbi:MAG: NAD+ synthase [Gammaproteobacteria bacterium RIFCSPHIGHO2_12_FULL_41_20]|nr:MAG: NAD+ synthase [Gammaproteobacteria bacterium RIFCSPHIGHO2_12_FULL_41_20]